MKKQISNISGHQTSKVFALLYAALTVPLAVIGVIAFLFGSPPEVQNSQSIDFPWLFFVFAPLLYGGIGYIFTRLGCFVYNFIAKRFGGIEFTVTENEKLG